MQLNPSKHHDVLPAAWRPAIAQVGWLGHSGTVYDLETDPSKTERAGFMPLYIHIGSWKTEDKSWIIKD